MPRHALQEQVVWVWRFMNGGLIGVRVMKLGLNWNAETVSESLCSQHQALAEENNTWSSMIINSDRRKY